MNKRTLKFIFFTLCLGLTLSLNIYFRTFPINFPQLKIQAKNIVKQNIYQEAVKEINNKFIDAPSLIKDKLVKSLVLEKKRQKKIIKNQILQEYLRLKDRYQDDSGSTYLMEFDCWHWARYVDNVLKHGYPGDKIVKGRQFDSLMLAPSGMNLHWNNFLFYISSFLYKIFSLIKPVPLFTFLFYLPLFLIGLFIIILYLFCLRYWGNLCAITASSFVGMAPIFLQRSSAGWFDTDILNLFFPLLIIWSYLLVFNASTFKKRLFWIFLAGFWTGLFSFTWHQWWFIFLIVIIYEIYSLLNWACEYLQYKIKNFNLLKLHIFSSVSFLLFSFLWIIIFSGFEPLKNLYFQVKDALILNKALTSSIWPNVYATVQELKKAGILEMAYPIGGQFLFTLSLGCMLVLLFLLSKRKSKYTAFKQEAMLIFTIWFIIMFFSCFRGIRFTIFLLLPLGISLGWMINEVIGYFSNKKWINIVVLVIVIVFQIKFINNASIVAKEIFPFMNDVWYKTLVDIKEISPKEAIINSWWDYGDWFKAVSERRVIFDGQSQNTPQAYWMACVLTTDNEEEAMAILRMLNNGGNQAFELINRNLKDPFKSIFILKKALSSTPEIARKNLLEFLLPSDAEQIIKLLFDKPDRAIFVVDYAMQNKMSTISYLSNWNLAKVYLSQNIHKKRTDEITDFLMNLGIDKQSIERLYQEINLISGRDLDNWISERAKIFYERPKGKEKNGIILFEQGLVYNPTEKQVYLYSQQENIYKIPRSLFLFERDSLKEISYPDYDLDFSVLIFRTEKDYQAVFLDRNLAKSLFARLYFLEGKGLKHFRKLVENSDGDDYIRVFEIIWD